MNSLDQIQAAVREGRYEMTFHATEEVAEDDLHLLDVESALLTGSLVSTQADPQCGPKYVVEGLAGDLATRAGVVARFQPGGTLVIFTVYEIHS
mgnify:CR=1 FL=1